MLNLLSKFFDSNNREITKLQPIIDEINAREEKLKKKKNLKNLKKKIFPN
jgi:preprotein translocase subunit SecA